MRETILVPDLAWRDGAFHSGLAVAIDASGRIARVGPAAGILGAVERLSGRALLPGFVDAHSHAFQRLLRGRVQSRPAGAAADFWSWREAMYAVSQALSPDDVFVASRFCFLEKLRAGITAVGEFHYLRNDPAGRPYDDPHEIAGSVIAAAREVGLRIALLDAAYVTSAIGRPLEPGQRRFATPDLDRYLGGVSSLAQRWAADPAVTVGLAPHSVRAVPRPWLTPLARWARERRVPVHAHVAEQTAEVEACRAAYGKGPVELLAAEEMLDERFTAVHATHVAPSEIGLLARAGATVCACPTTEADLGDGFLPGAELRAAGVPIALGTDSQAVVDPFAEMRAVELHERLRHRRRAVLGVERGGQVEVAPALLEMAGACGARALGLAAGRIEPGAWADLAAVDLEHPALAGAGSGALAAALALGATAAVVSDVWVGGRRRVAGGRHDAEGEASAAFRELAARIETGGGGSSALDSAPS